MGGIGQSTTYLFLVDPSVTFYLQCSSAARQRQTNDAEDGPSRERWEGWDELVEKINREIGTGQYDRVAVIGSSMGATAILALCGRFHTCDAAIVFNPLVDLVRETRLG